MPSRKTSRLIFGPSDSSYRKTQTFATINDSVETQKVVRRTLSVSGMGTIRAFYLATHFPAPQKSLCHGQTAVRFWNLSSDIGGETPPLIPENSRRGGRRRIAPPRQIPRLIVRRGKPARDLQGRTR